ncbi:hypothetical protein D3C81_2315720 [compost metagenome]
MVLNAVKPNIADVGLRKLSPTYNRSSSSSGRCGSRRSHGSRLLTQIWRSGGELSGWSSVAMVMSRVSG